LTATPVLETRGLGRRFGGLKAVDDVSFSVPEGQVLGVIGPNGAGKSTFINLVTGHIRPTSGQVLIQGRDMTGAKPWSIAHAGVSRTFQIVKPFRGMSVRENVAVGILYGRKGTSRMSQALEQADEVLAEVGLSRLGDRAPGGLSVADARRLEFAKALALRPRLLLLDEVMAGLRPTETDRMVAILREINRERGMTILLIEHVMRAVMALASRVLVLHHGASIAEGTPAEVVRNEAVIHSYLGVEDVA
jgi:branched-chain amino acid transport system ATP-binding protein